MTSSRTKAFVVRPGLAVCFLLKRECFPRMVFYSPNARSQLPSVRGQAARLHRIDVITAVTDEMVGAPYLDLCDETEEGWRSLPVNPNSLYTFVEVVPRFLLFEKAGLALVHFEFVDENTADSIKTRH